MRRTSSKRHVIAFVLVFLAFALFSYIPTLIEMAEFYLFQHTQSDYVVEDYKYITESLTEVELLQLSKQFIPNPSVPEKKKPQLNQKVQTSQKIKTSVPIIVENIIDNEHDLEEIQPDTAIAESGAQETEEEVTDDTEDDGLYLVVEEMPAFPGGETGLMEYIYKNLRYPYAATSQNIENCVICTFIIDTKGSVTHVEITQSAHPLLDREALRVVKTLPKWRPGKKQGKPVRVKYTLPIIFRLK